MTPSPTAKNGRVRTGQALAWYGDAWPQRARVWLVLGFVALLCVTGGSARATVPSLFVLRPASVLVLTALLCLPSRQPLGPLRWVAGLLAAWAAVIAIQLVPLPPAVWMALPGRQSYVGGLEIIGQRPWHAIALFPDRAWSSLLDLLPPAIILVAFRDMPTAQRIVLLPALFIVAMLCALLGVAQISAGPGSLFYLYSYATQDSPVGFFANRNHEAVMLAAMLPLLRAWTLATPPGRVMRQRMWMAMMIAVLLIGAALVTGSRAGFVMIVLGAFGAFLIQPSIGQRRARWVPAAIGMAVVLGIVLLAAIFALSSRLPALSRLMTFAPDDELRFRFLPILARMVAWFFPFGSGFGSFEPLFRSFEPDSALKFTIFNNAHNDLIEAAITGGLLAILVILATIGWWARATWHVFAQLAQGDGARYLGRASGWAIGMVLLASLVDYPLRTPLFATIATLWFCWLSVGLGGRRIEVIASRAKPTYEPDGVPVASDMELN